MTAIALIAYRRPEYLERCLAGLAACEGVADAVLHAHIEPGCERTRALIEGFDACEVRPVFNAERLGCNPNTAAALAAAFGTADYAVFLEEDIVPARDFLVYHNWAAHRYRGEAGVGSVAAYHRRAEACPPEEHHTVRRRVGFHGWGCGSWRDRLGARLPEFRPDLSWDTMMDRAYRETGTVEVYPELSRCQNIGLTSSMQDGPEFTPGWFLRHHRLRHWAGNTADLGQGEFIEGPTPLAPQLDRG